jgi:hypothetical protein
MEHRQGRPVGLLLRRRPQDPSSSIACSLANCWRVSCYSYAWIRAIPSLQIVDRRAHADRLTDRRRAGLELVLQIRQGAGVHKHVLDHLVAAQERRHRLEDFLPRPQKAHSDESAQLERRAHQEIAARKQSIMKMRRNSLCSITHRATIRSIA